MLTSHNSGGWGAQDEGPSRVCVQLDWESSPWSPLDPGRVGPYPRQAGRQSGNLQVEPAEGTKGSLLLHFLCAGRQVPAASPLQGSVVPATYITNGRHAGAVRDASRLAPGGSGGRKA